MHRRRRHFITDGIVTEGNPRGFKHIDRIEDQIVRNQHILVGYGLDRNAPFLTARDKVVQDRHVGQYTVHIAFISSDSRATISDRIS